MVSSTVQKALLLALLLQLQLLLLAADANEASHDAHAVLHQP